MNRMHQQLAPEQIANAPEFAVGISDLAHPVVKVIQQACDVLMPALSFHGYGCSCSLAPRFEEPSNLSA